jgi:hypothetical protein
MFSRSAPGKERKRVPFCKVCVSPDRNAIDDSLDNGATQLDVAKQYGLSPHSVGRHVRGKHPRAEILAEIGEEPSLPSHEWIQRHARARGIPVAELFVLKSQSDPFYCGSPTDVKQAEWFTEIWHRFNKGLGDDEKKHLRYLHYRCVVSEEPPLWLDGTEYQNTEDDWEKLKRYSRPARWLGLVEAELFEDKRNEPPVFNAPRFAFVLDPSLVLPEWSQWRMPQIDSTVWTPNWNIPPIPEINSGYLSDKYLDQPSMVGIFIEKSTMNSWLSPLCKEMDVDLYVASGFQSITNAVTFVKRAAELRKPAHLLIISDHDPQGEKMPLASSRHIEYRLRQRFPNIEITADVLALTPEQIKRHKLPRAPI